LATDLRSENELKESLGKLKELDVEYILGQHRTEDFIKADLIIKNPGVPENSEFLMAAKNAGVAIESDIGIFWELCPAEIIGVTGTKGKSTIATLISEILKTNFPQVILAGNIRASVLEKLPEIFSQTEVVLELSSWQLADSKNHKKSPHIAVITNILMDHLNRYDSLEDYISDKKVIFQSQKKDDFLILNFNDTYVKKMADEAIGQVYFYSTDNLLIKELNSNIKIGAYVENTKIYFGEERKEICDVADIKLIGKHNLSDALAAITVACLKNIPAEKIRIALQKFNGLEGRLQLIIEKDNVKYINDTTATAPDATIASLNALDDFSGSKKIILISGGADKNLDFMEFSKAIKEKCKAVILLPGTATQKIKDAIGNYTVKEAVDMKEAVESAKFLSEKGDIILLSPGCASFGLFRHEFERGEKFNEAVKNL